MNWAMVLYRRYIELYGEPIDQSIPNDAGNDPAGDASAARPRSQ